MDFTIWSALQKKVGSKSHPNVDSLKQSLEAAWADLDPEVVRVACANVRKRLKAVVAARGGHIE